VKEQKSEITMTCFWKNLELCRKLHWFNKNGIFSQLCSVKTVAYNAGCVATVHRATHTRSNSS